MNSSYKIAGGLIESGRIHSGPTQKLSQPLVEGSKVLECTIAPEQPEGKSILLVYYRPAADNPNHILTDKIYLHPGGFFHIDSFLAKEFSNPGFSVHFMPGNEFSNTPHTATIALRIEMVANWPLLGQVPNGELDKYLIPEGLN